jgi:hypothetical protein
MALTVSRLDTFIVGSEAEARLGFVVADVTFDSSYDAGGESLVPADLGLQTIRCLQAHGKGAGNRVCEYDYANAKLRLYTALGTEATTGSNQSSIVVRVVAVGKAA